MSGLEGEWRAAAMEEQPRPVVLDPHRRAHLPKLLSLVSLNQAKSPWILCRGDGEEPDGWHIPLKTLNGRFMWPDIMSTLYARGVKSVMIEGGATVINEVLTNRTADVVIITIAPVFIGRDGVGIGPTLQECDWLHDVRTLSVAHDMIIAGRMKDKPTL